MEDKTTQNTKLIKINKMEENKMKNKTFVISLVLVLVLGLVSGIIPSGIVETEYNFLPEFIKSITIWG